MKSIHRVLAPYLLVCLSLGAVPLAQASTSSLGLDSSLNLLSFGNFFAPSSDVQGRVAVGGNANITSYSIDTLNGSSALYGGTGLTVGGNLTAGRGSYGGNTVIGGSLFAGSGATFLGNLQVAGDLNANNNWLSAPSISYGGTASGLQQWQDPAAVKVAAGSIQTGINFGAEQQRLSSLSQSFDALATTGKGISQYGTVTFDTKGAALAVFDLSSTDVINNLNLSNVGANTTVILNVHGASIDFGNHGYQNFVAGHVLFNLPDATQITFGSGVNASFLAPLASFSSNGGLITGQVVVADWSGNTQVNDAAFIGNVAAVPEPETYAMLLAGLGLIGGIARRRKNTPV